MLNTSGIDTVFSVHFDGDPIRFSPSGEVCVMDAIRALTGLDDAEPVWEELKERQPGLLADCREFHFEGDGDQAALVAGSMAWHRITLLLFNMMSAQDTHFM